MHRTHWSGILGVSVIPGLAVHWVAGLMILAGVVWTRALTGVFAVMVGLTVLFPKAIIPLVLLSVLAVWLRHRYPPGAILDTSRARLLSWIYLLGHLAWLGHGPGSARLALEAAHLRSEGYAMDGGPARNEPLELLYEYGLMAVVAFVAVGWWVWPHLHLGDPATATGASVLAVCSVTAPFRAFWKWLRGDRASLFGPPLRVSLSVHMDQRGQVTLYGPRELDRRDAVDIGIALVMALQDWQKTHEILPEELYVP